MVLKPNWKMLNKVQRDNHNVTANEKQIITKMGMKFGKIAIYMYFVIKFVLIWS